MYKMEIKVVLALLAVLSVVNGCTEHRDCFTCARSSRKFGRGFLSFSVPCRWCPLSNTCHTTGSVKDHCLASGHSADSASECAAVADAPANYDSSLAEELSKWSSLAYLNPTRYDKASIQSAVKTQINSNYEVVEFLTMDCDWIFQFDHCAAVIAKSTADNRIVIAYEGTSSPEQLTEQFLLGVSTGKTNFRPTGGEVFEYNKKTHDGLYPCVKSLVQGILSTLPTAEVIVTGHSLGGAQSQLTGASLLKDGVVPQSKLHVYTFGSPRVGDRDFAYGYDRLLGNSWRVTRKDDPIPLAIPKILFGYHTKKEVYYGSNGIMSATTLFKICSGNEEDNGCTDGEGICIKPSCFTDVHQQYFSSDLPRFMSGFISKGTPPTQGMRGACKSYAI